MKKYAIAALSLCAVLMTACAEDIDENPTQGVDTESVTIGGEQNQKTDSVKSEAEDGADDQAKESPENDSSSEGLYESFLAGEAKVHFNSENMNFENWNTTNIENKELTIQELADSAKKDFVDEEFASECVSDVEYSYIDCGNDGTKELLVKITAGIPEGVQFDNYMIIRDNAGSLQTVFGVDSWDRSYVTVNEYGVIKTDGSGGWGTFSFNKSYVDGNGAFHPLYGSYVTEYIDAGTERGSLWFNGSSHELDVNTNDSYAFLAFNLDGKDGDETYSYARIIENPGDQDSGSREYYYGSLDDDDSIYDDSNSLKQFFDREGLKIETIKDIDKMIADREAAEGFTDDLDKGAEVTTQPLK